MWNYKVISYWEKMLRLRFLIGRRPLRSSLKMLGLERQLVMFNLKTQLRNYTCDLICENIIIIRFPFLINLVNRRLLAAEYFWEFKVTHSKGAKMMFSRFWRSLMSRRCIVREGFQRVRWFVKKSRTSIITDTRVYRSLLRLFAK